MNIQSSNCRSLIEMIKWDVNKLIELQKGEDAVPNSPGHRQKCEDYQTTFLVKRSREIAEANRQLQEKDTEFDAEMEWHRGMIGCLSKAFEAMNIKELDVPVDEYPFKTEIGKEIEAIVSSIVSRLDNIEGLVGDLTTNNLFWVINELKFLEWSLRHEFDLKRENEDGETDYFHIWECLQYLNRRQESLLHRKFSPPSILLTIRFWIQFKFRQYKKRLRHFALRK